MKKYSFIILLLFLCVSSFAKGKQVRCGGTYSYTYSENISHAEAKAKAIIIRKTKCSQILKRNVVFCKTKSISLFAPSY